MGYKSKLLSQISADNSDKTQSISLLMANPELEPVIQIESDLRTITIPDELKNIAVVGDHLSETIYFSCPRYFDGEDLSSHTCIIRFINAGHEYGESPAVDMEPDEEMLKFGWAIDRYATKYDGVINFTVQFETKDSNGISYQWQTQPAQLSILPALDIDDTINGDNELLFRTLSNQVADLQEKTSNFETQILEIESIKKDIENLKSEINYLKENVVYTLTE